jgi:galactonate dehydratase
MLSAAVKDVERTWVKVPFRPLPARHMIRENNHWTYVEICKVRLACGVQGFGETMPCHTWGFVTDDEVDRVVGREATEMMWDDSVGSGIQQALFDAVGKMLDVPVHRLLGRKCRDHCALSWWVVDMPGSDWIEECRTAIDLGYLSLKAKGRPWFDLVDQCQLLSEALPDGFETEIDFNDSLLTAKQAIPVLRQVEPYEHVARVEDPIPQSDLAGIRDIREHVRFPIATHTGLWTAATAVTGIAFDGFVVTGGVSEVIRSGTLLAAADQPFFLQQVGTGITASFVLHCAATLSHARWPAVTCHELFAHPLIRPAIKLLDGLAPVPQEPGLGVALDEDAIERFRTEPLRKVPYPVPGQLIEIRWPSGQASYYAHARQYLTDFLHGRFPIFEKGVQLESVPDDGSKEWADLQARASKACVETSAPLA